MIPGIHHIVAALIAMAAPALAETATPSGYTHALFEAIHEADAGLWRFRYLSQGLTLEDYASVADDFLHLCEADILPALAQAGETANQIVISIADREVPFGTSDPQAVQFFEAFHVENDSCIWEEF